MKTVEIKIFEFNELSDKAKQNAIEWYRGDGIDNEMDYSDAKRSVELFCDMLNLKTGRNSWLDPYMDHIDDNIINLSGLRLRTWIINNFAGLFTPSFRGCIDREIHHKRMRIEKYKSGNVSSFYYSGVFKDNSCVLTGVCWDMELLYPIYNFIKKPDLNMDFETLISDCFNSLRTSLEKENEYQNSEEAIIESIQANCYEFTENGKLF